MSAPPRCPHCGWPAQAEPGDPICHCDARREEGIRASLFDGDDAEYAERLTPEGLPWPDNWPDPDRGAP